MPLADSSTHSDLNNQSSLLLTDADLPFQPFSAALKNLLDKEALLSPAALASGDPDKLSPWQKACQHLHPPPPPESHYLTHACTDVVPTALCKHTPTRPQLNMKQHLEQGSFVASIMHVELHELSPNGPRHLDPTAIVASAESYACCRCMHAVAKKLHAESWVY
jgi:hypothetical protein